MTETDWLKCTNPEPLLEFLRGRTSERKLRLFAAACCRRVWVLIDDEAACRLVELTEEVADGVISKRKLAAARRKVTADDPEYDPIDHLENGNDMSPYGAAIGAAVYSASSKMTAIAAGNAAVLASYAPQLLENDINEDDPAHLMTVEEFAQADLIRDIFGNPFRPVTVDPAWLTPTVVSLAQAIYDEQEFDHLPILADALEDAGCSSREILDHCRQPGDHVRGCWVVDLLLNKE